MILLVNSLEQPHTNLHVRLLASRGGYLSTSKLTLKLYGSQQAQGT